MKASVDIPDELYRQPPWFALARKHLSKVRSHEMDRVRESIGRGWAKEVADSEVALRKPKKR
jgi:hypothetical protein